MSGKGSRERRKQAVERARSDVYASNGDTVYAIPYPDDQRMQRIYEASYANWRCHYWRMESIVDEMFQVYGGERPMPSNV
jgi:hypothetical protein